MPQRQLCRRTNARGWGFTAAAPGQSRQQQQQLVIKSVGLNGSSQGGSWRAKETGATGLTPYAHVHVRFTSGPGAAGSGRRSNPADSGSKLPVWLRSCWLHQQEERVVGVHGPPPQPPPQNPPPAFNTEFLLVLQLLFPLFHFQASALFCPSFTSAHSQYESIGSIGGAIEQRQNRKCIST